MEKKVEIIVTGKINPDRAVKFFAETKGGILHTVLQLFRAYEENAWMDEGNHPLYDRAIKELTELEAWRDALWDECALSWVDVSEPRDTIKRLLGMEAEMATDPRVSHVDWIYCPYCGDLMSDHLITSRGGMCEKPKGKEDENL